MKLFLKGVILLTGVVIATVSNATIIDFAAQSGALGTVGDVTFDQLGTHANPYPARFTVRDVSGVHGNYVYNNYGEDLLGFTFDNAVTLSGFDITRDPECCGGSGNAVIDVLLYDAVSSLISTTSVAGGTDWQTLIFDQTGVSRVVFDVAPFYNSWGGHSDDHDWFGLDNISYEADAVPAPAPATLALFGFGLAGLGWSKRKKA